LEFQGKLYEIVKRLQIDEYSVIQIMGDEIIIDFVHNSKPYSMCGRWSGPLSQLELFDGMIRILQENSR
jgi:hypothetical protein